MQGIRGDRIISTCERGFGMRSPNKGHLSASWDQPLLAAAGFLAGSWSLYIFAVFWADECGADTLVCSAETRVGALVVRILKTATLHKGWIAIRDALCGISRRAGDAHHAPVNEAKRRDGVSALQTRV